MNTCVHKATFLRVYWYVRFFVLTLVFSFLSVSHLSGEESILLDASAVFDYDLFIDRWEVERSRGMGCDRISLAAPEAYMDCNSDGSYDFYIGDKQRCTAARSKSLFRPVQLCFGACSDFSTMRSNGLKCNCNSEGVQINGEYRYKSRQDNVDGAFDHYDHAIFKALVGGALKVDVNQKSVFQIDRIKMDKSKTTSVQADMNHVTGRRVIDDATTSVELPGEMEEQVLLHALAQAHRSGGHLSASK